MSSKRKAALCLNGGGLTGALFQVGALSALEAVFDAPSFELYVGTSSGSPLAAALAGGLSVQRLYRALIDPADNYFPLERSHLLSLDLAEWKRTAAVGLAAMRRGFASLVARSPTPMPSDVLEQLDRLFDAMPAGVLSLDRFEGFLSDFFLRRQVPNSFRAMKTPLFITATDLDAGEPALFGEQGLDHVPISLACAASSALPVFFSPVRIGTHYYCDGAVAPVTEIDVAMQKGAELIVLIDPNVPVQIGGAGEVPTGYGSARSVRDKGMMWVYNQSMRTIVHARTREAAARARAAGVPVLHVQPTGTDAVRFMQNAASITARREILQWAHRAARDHIRQWAIDNNDAVAGVGWRASQSPEPASVLPAAME